MIGSPLDDGTPDPFEGPWAEPEEPPRPRRWWVPVLVLVVAGALLAPLIRGLLPPERLGSGTGFVIAESGLVLTAAHVVRDARAVTVERDGRRHRAEVVAVSAEHDLALLAVPGMGAVPAAVLGDSATVQVGEGVVAVGFPAGSVVMAAVEGDVLGVGWRAIGPGGAVLGNLVAVQGEFLPGYSGAPLLNMSGEVIGIVGGTLAMEDGQEVGFAVAADRARAWLAGRGVALAPPPRERGPARSPTEVVQAVRSATVRVEARLPEERRSDRRS